MHDPTTLYAALFILGFFVVNGLKAYFAWQKAKQAKRWARWLAQQEAERRK